MFYIALLKDLYRWGLVSWISVCYVLATRTYVLPGMNVFRFIGLYAPRN